MENQFYILPSFYRYNSEKLPTMSLEKQSEIIKKISAEKTLTNIINPVIKKVLSDGMKITNEREFRVLLKKKKSFLIAEGTYLLSLIHIFLETKEEFLTLTKKSVIQKHLTKSYLRDVLTQQLFVLNDIWKSLDIVVNEGVDAYYSILQKEISDIFKNKKSIRFYYDIFTQYEEIITHLEHSGILGYFSSNYIRFAELGYNAGYLNALEYETILNNTGHKIKWLFLNWDQYLLSVAFGAIVSQRMELYNDFLPVNRVLYNIKTIALYLPELFENTQIWSSFNKEKTIDFIDYFLLKMEITKTTQTQYLSYYKSYIEDVMNASYNQFIEVLIPIAKKHNILGYFINNNKNSYLVLPKNPFTTPLELEKTAFLNYLQPGEFPLISDGESMITSMGAWSKKTTLLKNETVFLESSRFNKLKIRMKNDLSFQLRIGRVKVLSLNPDPEKFDQSLEEFYLSKRDVIKKNLISEIPHFENFFTELFNTLNP